MITSFSDLKRQEMIPKSPIVDHMQTITRLYHASPQELFEQTVGRNLNQTNESADQIRP